jgi:ketosteroid isomerase-like protein
MHRFFRFPALVVAALFLQSSLLHAQPVDDLEQDHVQLRALRVRLVDAINKGDINAIDADLHPNIVITWQDGQVCKGRDQVRKFYENMVSKSKKTFQGYKVPPTADEKTILYSGATTGVVYGKSVGRFFLAGKEIEVPNRWTATVVKENGQWTLASYHVSMNVLDNPLLNGIKKSSGFVAGIALIAGLLIGWLLGKRKAARAA